MGVKLRLARHGGKKSPYYRIVAADIRAPRDGKYIEHVGSFDPTTTPETVRLRPARIRYWLGVGALPSTTVKNIFRDYLETSETLATEREIDPATAVWVQGPANSPASVGLAGAPQHTRPEITLTPSQPRAQRGAEPTEEAATAEPAKEAAAAEPAKEAAAAEPTEEAAAAEPTEEAAAAEPTEEAAAAEPTEEAAAADEGSEASDDDADASETAEKTPDE